MNGIPVSMPDVLALAERAEENNQPGVARALYEVAGRMGRDFGGDGYDSDESRDAAYARGITRASRMATSHTE